MADKKEDLRGYFSANKIPTQDHFYELINEIAIRSNGIEKLKDGPLKIVTENADEIISLHRKFGEEIEKGWSLKLQNSEGGSVFSINGNNTGRSRLFIDDETGNVIVGMGPIKGDHRLYVDGNLYVKGDVHITGGAYKDTAGDKWISGSDERLKDYEPLQGSLDKLLRLEGVSFTWKDKYIPPKDEKTHIGFIAQAVEKVFPDWVDKTNEQEYRLNIEGFEALTVESIRELNSKIESSDKDDLHIINFLSVGGVIQPSAGNSEANGIMFPKNPGDGSNYAAWIRYYPGSGENTVLEIGTSNDLSNHLVFNVSGNVGIGTTNPTHKFHVIAQDAVGLFESTGGQAFLRLSTKEGIDNRVEITNRPGGRLSLWTASGGDAFNITKNGNIGIGTINPTHKFHVVAQDAVGLFESTGGQAFLRLSTKEGIDNRVEITNRPGGRLSLWTAGGGDAFNVTKDGNVGIGTANPSAKLDIAGNISTNGNISFGANVRQMLNLWGKEYGIGVQGGTLYFRTANSYSWHLNGVHNDSFCNPGTNGVRLMSLNAAGDLILSAKTNPQADPNKSMCRALVDAGESLVINWDNDYKKGVYINGLKSPSDIRRKKNIYSLKDSLKKITSLEGVQFEWRYPESELGVQLGLIAQHVESIFPEVVEDGPDGFKGINYSGLIAPLIEAVKEQQMQINSLSEKISKINGVQ